MIVDTIESLPEGSRLLLLAPVVRGRKGTHQAVLEEIQKSGFVRARVDGQVYNLEEEITLDRYKIHTIEAVVDRLILPHNENSDQIQEFRSRLTDSVETALKFGDGYLTIQDVTNPQQPRDIHFSEHLACPDCGISIPEIEPRTFSFNTPHGACPECQGLGGKLEIDPELLIPNPDLSLSKGAIAISEWSGQKEKGGWYWQSLESAARHYGFDLDTPVRDLPPEALDIVLYGSRGKEITMRYRNPNGEEFTFRRPFEGVIRNLERRYLETHSDYMRERIASYVTVPDCAQKHSP
jgi:excinuclease ABC subunit A